MNMKTNLRSEAMSCLLARLQGVSKAESQRLNVESLT